MVVDFQGIGFHQRHPKTIFLVGNFNHPKLGTIFVNSLGLPGFPGMVVKDQRRHLFFSVKSEQFDDDGYPIFYWGFTPVWMMGDSYHPMFFRLSYVPANVNAGFLPSTVLTTVSVQACCRRGKGRVIGGLSWKSKVVSTHLWNTSRATFTNIVLRDSFRKCLGGDCRLGCAISGCGCCNFLGGGSPHLFGRFQLGKMQCSELLNQPL